jgi:hypothetical protein
MASYMSSARLVRPLLLASAIALLAACGSDSNGPGDADVSGQYGLVTVQGQTLPYTITTSEHTFVITSADALFNDNGSYEVSMAGTEDGSDEEEVAADNGTFTVSGNTVTLHSAVFFTSYQATVASNGDVTAAVPAALLGAGSSTIAFTFSKAN